ncbi:MAG: hypothetical protein KatS3mg081_2514 [Gemmatimonadales bacterium]|nr:MAG: hypothetical protein KatS3mg081_2514 [Gemmatimonadales bacterium]
MYNRLARAVMGAALLALAPALARAQGMAMQGPKGVDATVTGTVVDVSCKFAHGLSGADHRMCAQVCADKGIPLAILGDDGKLYLPLSEGMPGEGQNARLKDFAEQQVTVKGKVFSAGGAQGILISQIARKS